MEHTKKPCRGRGQEEERFQNQENALRMSVGTEPRSSSEEPERQPRKGDKNRIGSPDHKKVCGQRNYSGEREVPRPQNEKAVRAELQPSKAETDNPWPGLGEDSMLRVSGVA